MLLDGLTVIDRPAPGILHLQRADEHQLRLNTVCTAYFREWASTPAPELAGAGVLRVVIFFPAATGSATALGRLIAGLPPLFAGSDWR